MISIRNRGAIAAIVTLTLLTLPLAPASAAPWEAESPARAEESLATQIWEWLASLFGGTTSGGGETLTAGSCTATSLSRGCAIDPNGGSY